MTYAIIIPLILICGLWRLTDGGWYRLPGSNVIGWLLPSIIVGGLTLNPYLAVAALILGRQWTQGYEDWNNYLDQAIRCYPALVFGGVVLGLGYFSLADIHHVALGAGVLAVAITNAIQPWTRAQFDSHLSNRQAEFIEGLGVGICAVSVAL